MKKPLSLLLSVMLAIGWAFAEPQTAHAAGSVWLVAIGGGASGGRSEAQGHRSGPGGGGAGAYYENTAYAVVSQAYVVVIGNGGVSVTNTGGALGNLGATTSFGVLEVGGGAGGGFHSDGVPSVAIGKGQDSTSAGGGSCCLPTWTGGSTTPSSGVGYDGGSVNGVDAGAGGGGAASRGQSPASGITTGGAGGAGATSTITGSAVCRAGGGGGGFYNNTSSAARGPAVCGGGYGGETNAAGQAATANTGAGGGGGGGGTATAGNSGTGGSGVVIVAYKKDGSDGVATSTGGDITSTATHWIHTFITSGEFTPTVTGESQATTTPYMYLWGDILLGGDLIMHQ